jgi:hypothetical protein
MGISRSTQLLHIIQMTEIKKKVNGKSKGSSFERVVAKALSTHLTPLTFIRSPGSGARTGGKNMAKFGMMFGEDAMKIFTADVVPTNERDTNLNFRWSIECKSYKTQDNFTSLFSGTAKIFSWFNESIIDAKKINKKPMLIFKWNQTSTFVAISQKDLSILYSTSIFEGRLLNIENLTIFNLNDLLPHKNFWYTDNTLQNN